MRASKEHEAHDICCLAALEGVTKIKTRTVRDALFSPFLGSSCILPSQFLKHLEFFLPVLLACHNALGGGQE